LGGGHFEPENNFDPSLHKNFTTSSFCKGFELFIAKICSELCEIGCRKRNRDEGWCGEDVLSLSRCTTIRTILIIHFGRERGASGQQGIIALPVMTRHAILLARPGNLNRNHISHQCSFIAFSSDSPVIKRCIYPFTVKNMHLRMTN
jgi:hypothetical protein